LKNANRWSRKGYHVNHDIDEAKIGECRVRFGLGIMMVTIITNAVETAIMLMNLLMLRTLTSVAIGERMVSLFNDPGPAPAFFAKGKGHAKSQVAGSDSRGPKALYYAHLLLPIAMVDVDSAMSRIVYNN
jgi:hypothetical protein